MIFTERTIKVSNGTATIDAPVILYRGDRKIEIKFTIVDAKFKFSEGSNMIVSMNASYAQLAIINPNGTNAFTEIAKTEDGVVVLEITAEMIDQLEEVGFFSFHIRLYDNTKESRISLPPIERGIEVREPITSEDNTSTIGIGEVGYAVVLDNEEVLDIFDKDGDYNKTVWSNGDIISSSKMNKVEDALFSINKKSSQSSDVTSSDITLYVSPTGNDSNDGKSSTSPLATIKKAISLGATTVLCERGDYYNQPTITSTNKIGKKLRIMPSNKNVFSTSEPEVQLIRLIFADKLESLAESDGLLTQVVANNAQLKAVFIDKSMAAIASTSTTNPGYNATVWQMHEDFTLDVKLKPVLTKDECKGEKGTFFYDGAKIYINPFETTYTHFMLPTGSNNDSIGLYLDGYSEVILEDISVEFSFKRNLCVTNSMDCTIRNCRTSYSMLSDGIGMDYSNANLYNCISYKNRNDGFNIHGYGESNFYNCSAYYNYDDGISHHDGCYGVVEGGVYHHNGKGGVASPTYGAYVDIYNVECYENVYGIYAQSDTNNRRSVGRVFNSVLHDNTSYDIDMGYADITMYNTNYGTKNKRTTATLTEYGSEAKDVDLSGYVTKDEYDTLHGELFGSGYNQIVLRQYIYNTEQSKWLLQYNRASTVDSYELKTGDTVSTDFSIYKLSYYMFDENGVFVKGGGWSTSTLSLPLNGFYYFYLARIDSAAFTTEELVTAAETIEISRVGSGTSSGVIGSMEDRIRELETIVARLLESASE